MDRIIAFSMFALLLLAGCAGESQAPAEGSSASQAAAQQTAAETPVAQATGPETASEQFEKYSGPLFSFEYPAGMKVKENNGTTPGGDEYGMVSMAKGERAIAILWMEFHTTGADADARVPVVFMNNYITKDDAVMDLLDNATNVGEQESYVIMAKGFEGTADPLLRSTEEVPFEKEMDGKLYYCYAIEYYEPDLDREVSVRIVSDSREDAKVMRDRFVETFLFSNWEKVYSRV